MVLGGDTHFRGVYRCQGGVWGGDTHTSVAVCIGVRVWGGDGNGEPDYKGLPIPSEKLRKVGGTARNRTWVSVTLLLFCSVSLLLFYSVTLLLCYSVTLLHCYFVTLLLHYYYTIITLHITLLLHYTVTGQHITQSKYVSRWNLHTRE